MKYKSLLLSLVIAIGVLAAPFRAAYCFEQTPESLVREFYTWYTKNSLELGTLPEFDDTIYKYVCACTVDRLRIEFNMAARDFDYFVDSNDFLSEWLSTFTSARP